MYILKVLEYFLQKNNKIEYIFVCFGKSIERGTLFIGFCLALSYISYKHKLTNNFASDIFGYLMIYLAIIPVYGIFREISFDYKATLKTNK